MEIQDSKIINNNESKIYTINTVHIGTSKYKDLLKDILKNKTLTVKNDKYSKINS